jgi:lysophospholipase
MAYQASAAEWARAPSEGIRHVEPPQLEVIKAKDGLSLRAAFWNHPSEQPACGTVLILQGRTEFMEKYVEVIAELLERGFSVASFDWRGQGLSERQVGNPAKGHVEDFDDYLLDLSAIVAAMAARDMPKPWNLFAHSMGGAVALLALATGPSPFERAVLSAPLIGLSGLKGHWVSRLTARILTSLGFSRSFVPGGGSESFSLAEAFATNPLTSDEARYAQMGAWLHSEPRLGLGAPTIGWIDAAFIAMERFEDAEFGRGNQTPILMILSGEDDVVSTPAAEALALRLRGASSITLPGARHEILMERDELRDLFWRAFDAFSARTAELDATVKETETPVPVFP